MLLIVGTLRLSPGNLERARADLRRLIEATRREAGCRAYNYAEDVLDPGLIHVDELWTDQAAFDGHLTSPHVAEWRRVNPAYAIHDRDLRAYEVGAARRI